MLTLPTPRRELSLLQLTQPVLLRLYVDAFLAQTMEALLARRPPSRLCTRGHAVSSRLWLAPTRRLLSPGAAQLRPRAQHALAALVAGTLHLSDTLARWGAASHCSACPMCESSPDTLEHRMRACRAEGVPFAPRLPSWLAAAFRSAGPEAVPLVAERLWWEPPVDRASRLELLLAEHRDVELAFFGAEGEAFVAFLYDPEGGPLYTDGSALGASGEVGSVAFAIVQLRGDQVGCSWVAGAGVALVLGPNSRGGREACDCHRHHLSRATAERRDPI